MVLGNVYHSPLGRSSLTEVKSAEMGSYGAPT